MNKYILNLYSEQILFCGDKQFKIVDKYTYLDLVLIEHLEYTVNSTVSGHRQFRVTFRKTYWFFPNDIVSNYFDFAVIFSNFVAASNLMLAVET